MPRDKTSQFSLKNSAENERRLIWRYPLTHSHGRELLQDMGVGSNLVLGYFVFESEAGTWSFHPEPTAAAGVALRIPSVQKRICSDLSALLFSAIPVAEEA